MTDQSNRTRRAAAALVIRALRDAFYIAMHPQQTLAVSERDQGTTIDRITRWLPFAALAVAIDANTSPADVLHDLHEIDRFAQMQRFHAAVDLVLLEFCRLVYPKRIGRTNAKWKGETQAQEGSEPSFGQVEIPVREINTYVDISNQLLADSAGVAESEVRMALSEDFGLKEGTSFLKGTGPLEPEGILTAAGVTVVPTGNASTLGTNPADLLIDAMYSLPAGYRGRGSWLMNGKTLAAVRKFKDGTTGVYLWQPAYAAGQPETILGRPVIECPDMDDIGAGTTPIIRQGWVTQAPALNELERVILADHLIHAGHPVLRWCFDNVAIHTDSAGNRTMHKGKSRDRIDGAVATWMTTSSRSSICAGRRNSSCMDRTTKAKPGASVSASANSARWSAPSSRR